MRVTGSRRLARRIAAATLAAATALALCLPLAHVAHAQAKSASLEAVLNQMNAAAAKFTSAQADVRQELYTRIVQDTETQTGQIYFLHQAGAIQMGMKLLPPGAKPGAQPSQVVEFKNSLLRVFNPGTNHVDEFSATGKNQGLAENLMTLGFGGSGADLEKSWTITDQGPDTIDNVKTEKLDLVPKDAKIRDNYPHIAIWIDPARDVTLKQVFYEGSGGSPSGDTRTAYYTNIRLNQPVDTAPFAIKCKGKCS